MTNDVLGPMKELVKGLWSLGDYREIAPLLQPAADALAQACRIGPGQRVLDVAAGTGNLAAAAARLGARVTACDLTPQMVGWGRERTAGEGLEVEWREADVESLPFEDGRFDVVVSTFGAMFAPRPEVAAAELFRVAAPGATVALASWASDGFTGRYAAITATYAPPPPVALPSAFLWGDPDEVRRRLGPHAASVESERRSLWFEFDTVEGGREFWEGHNPAALALRTILPPERAADFREEGRRLMDELNRAGDGRLALESTYLLVLARKG
jgi:SAM-dependent methyltransferase